MQNVVILAGNIGQTPDVRTNQGATRITNFSLATCRPGLSEGRVPHAPRTATGSWTREYTATPASTVRAKTVAEHCEKGMKVLVQGRIHYTKWIDSVGNDRYGCEIIAEKVDLP